MKFLGNTPGAVLPSPRSRVSSRWSPMSREKSPLNVVLCEYDIFYSLQSFIFKTIFILFQPLIDWVNWFVDLDLFTQDILKWCFRLQSLSKCQTVNKECGAFWRSLYFSTICNSGLLRLRIHIHSCYVTCRMNHEWSRFICFSCFLS